MWIWSIYKGRSLLRSTYNLIQSKQFPLEDWCQTVTSSLAEAQYAVYNVRPVTALWWGYYIITVTSKIVKVPMGIQSEKSSKDMASSKNLVSTIGAQANPKKGAGIRCPEGLALPADMSHPSQVLHGDVSLFGESRVRFYGHDIVVHCIFGKLVSKIGAYAIPPIRDGIRKEQTIGPCRLNLSYRYSMKQKVNMLTIRIPRKYINFNDCIFESNILGKTGYYVDFWSHENQWSWL